MTDEERHLLQLKANRDWYGYLSLKNKYIYVGNCKCGSTFMRRVIARLEGLEEKGPAITPTAFFPKPHQMPRLVDAGYFVFTVTRNPVTRLFSAWAYTILGRGKGIYSKVPQSGYVPWVIDLTKFHQSGYPDLTVEGIRQLFESFVTTLYVTEYPILSYVNWRQQFAALAISTVPYSQIVDLKDLTRFGESLIQKYLGEEASLTLPPTELRNRSIIPYKSEYITDRCFELIKLMYKEDFEIFKYSIDTLPPSEVGDINIGLISQRLASSDDDYRRKFSKNKS